MKNPLGHLGTGCVAPFQSEKVPPSALPPPLVSVIRGFAIINRKAFSFKILYFDHLSQITIK